MKKTGTVICSLAAAFTKAFRILLVDDEETIRFLVRDVFQGLSLFELDTVATAREAERRINQGALHLCFCDLGITDCLGDQYYLLKKYSHRLPIIIMSGRASMEESAHCMSMGATWVFDKPIPLDRDFIVAVLNRFIPSSLFIQGTYSYKHARYREAIDALVTHKPVSVEEWARIIDVNERYLRKICECCSLSLHHMISTAHLIDHVLGCGTMEKADGLFGKSNVFLRQCQKLAEYYYLNKTAVDSFLGIGNGKEYRVPQKT